MREELDDALPNCPSAAQPMDTNRFRHDPAHRPTGVQRGKRILKDHLQPRRAAARVAAVEPHRSRTRPGEACDDSRERRLPAPALADKTEGFSARNRKAHAIYGAYSRLGLAIESEPPPRDGESLADVVENKEIAAHHRLLASRMGCQQAW